MHERRSLFLPILLFISEISSAEHSIRDYRTERKTYSHSVSQGIPQIFPVNIPSKKIPTVGNRQRIRRKTVLIIIHFMEILNISKIILRLTSAKWIRTHRIVEHFSLNVLGNDFKAESKISVNCDSLVRLFRNRGRNHFNFVDKKNLADILMTLSSTIDVFNE